ncbi:MAG: glycosyltransferase family 39 protein [Chloroflexota bacterium]
MWQTILPRALLGEQYKWLAPARGAGLFVVALAVYIAGRSPSLDDWDSVNFAKAIYHFDMRLQQPHPPGYPAYVFLARVVYTFTHEPVAALTLLSAICGALCLLALYALASDLGFGWAALPLAAMPLFWLNSDMAMTDVPGLLFAVAAVWLLHGATARQGMARRWWLGTGCAVAGFGAGVRPQDAVVTLAVMSLYVLPLLVRDRAWRDVRACAVMFVVACLLWAVPLLRSVGWDVHQLYQPIKTQVAYVQTADSMVGQPLTGIEVLDRLASFGSVFSAYFGGPREGGLNAFLGLSAAVVVLALLAGWGRATWLALSWLVPYGLFMLLVMQPTDPRKILPAIPPMLLLLGAASLRFRSWRSAGLAAGLALSVMFAAKGMPLARMLHTQLTPPEQAVAYITAHYSSDDTVILAGNSLNHIYYELPQYDSVAIDFVSEDELAQQLANGRYRYVISLDEWDTTVPLPNDWVRGASFDFERAWLVLPKASVVPFTVYERS